MSGRAISVTPLTFKEADATLTKADQKASEKDFASALSLYVKAAEAFLHLSRSIGTVGNPNSVEVAKVKASCREKASKALERAQQIKGFQAQALEKSDAPPLRSDILSQEQQLAIAHQSSRINGLRFPLWEGDPFTAALEGEGPFEDPDGPPSMSSEHILQSATWTRPARSGTLRISDDDMPVDTIVQNVVTDCSVVAAFAVCWDHHRRKGSKLCLSSIYPQDDRGLPKLSPSGRYIVKLHLNGTTRQVHVDDRLITAPTGRLLCASAAPGVLWPSIMEKAYMKAMGGYDFPGSDSSVDIHAFTGWIPEYVDLQSPTFQREKTWRRLLEGYTNGKCLVTLGTGDNLSRRFMGYQLIPRHSYAAVGFREQDEARKVRLLNPWKDAVLLADLQTITSDIAGLEMRDPDGKWSDWEDICASFDGLYINWDPSTFKHSVSVHGVWREDAVGGPSPSRRFQFSLSGTLSPPRQDHGQAWTLLTRHIVDKQHPRQWIALNVEKSLSGRDLSARDAIRLQSAYVDSTHVLRTITADRPSSISAIVSRDLPEDQATIPCSFTLTVFSDYDVMATRSRTEYNFTQTVASEFSGRTAGGNANHRTFMHNPQYTLKVPTSSSKVAVELFLEGSRHVPLNAKILYSNGRRVTEPKQGDVQLDTGPYAYGNAAGEALLNGGEYSIVLSTFEPGQESWFKLNVVSSAKISIVTIPLEGAGMFSKAIRGQWTRHTAAGNAEFNNYLNNPMYDITVPRSSTVFCRLQVTSPVKTSINATIFQRNNKGELGNQVATTGPYAERTCGVATDPRHLVGPATYTAVLSTFDAGVHANFEFVVYSSACPITVKIV